MAHAKDVYKMPDGFDPDTNNYQGLPVPDISMCQAQCPDSKRCRRHSDSGTAPHPTHQTYSDFKPLGKPGKPRACQSYYPVPHQHIKDA